MWMLMPAERAHALTRSGVDLCDGEGREPLPVDRAFEGGHLPYPGLAFQEFFEDGGKRLRRGRQQVAFLPLRIGIHADDGLALRDEMGRVQERAVPTDRDADTGTPEMRCGKLPALDSPCSHRLGAQRGKN